MYLLMRLDQDSDGNYTKPYVLGIFETLERAESWAKSEPPNRNYYVIEAKPVPSAARR